MYTLFYQYKAQMIFRIFHFSVEVFHIIFVNVANRLWNFILYFPYCALKVTGHNIFHIYP